MGVSGQAVQPPGQTSGNLSLVMQAEVRFKVEVALTVDSPSGGRGFGAG